MTDDELKDLVASLAVSQKKTDTQIKETCKQIKKLGNKIGGLGIKFGSYTEGLALPSMQSILQDRFNMETIIPSVRVKRNGKEIDVLAFANGTIN